MKVASSKGRILSPQAEKMLKRQIATEVKEQKQLDKAQVIERNTLKKNYKSIMQEFKELGNLKESPIETKTIPKVETEQPQIMKEQPQSMPLPIDVNNLFKIEQKDLVLPESPRFVGESSEDIITEEQNSKYKETQQSFLFPESIIIDEVKYEPIEEYNNKLENIKDQLDRINKEVERVNLAIDEKLSRL